MIVVSDTSPLNYLVLLDHVEILATLYRRVVIPDVVYDELTHPGAPSRVLEWAKHVPDWVEVVSTTTDEPDEGLDAGEAAAIQLAVELRADLLLIDDQPARTAARRRGLVVTGLLGVITAAAIRGLLDIEITLARLERETNFRLNQKLLQQALERVKCSKGRSEGG